MKIGYKLAINDAERKNFYSYLETLASRPDIKTVCEVGGGANPSMDINFIEKHGLEYTLLDISAEQMAKAPEQYQKVQADIASPNLALDKKYDLVFSRMLAEHVSSGLIFHRNVLNLLEEGGYAFHFFPTLYALPFVLNRLLPEEFSYRLLSVLNPHRASNPKRGKFPAYYSWCKGPVKSQIKSFEKLGFNVEEYLGFFGTPAYYRKFKPIQVLDKWISSLLVKHPFPQVTSYAYVLLQKNPKSWN